MILRDILNVKGRHVLSISPDATIAQAVEKLVANRCGALVVCKGERMVGIVSERDVLRTLSEVATSLDEVTVEDRMTSSVVTGTPEDNVNDTMGLLTNNRIRHLPVLEDGKLAGVISIGDVVKAQYDHLTMENHYLKNYIQS
jgi:CBS domain-containing protein